MKSFDVFYMKPDFFRDGIMGFKWCEEKGKLPKPSALSETHILLKQTEAESLESLFYNMQGEVWSPNGEAREMISSKGIRHTSMSVGDIAVDGDGKTWMVDRFGFKELTKAA